MFTYVIGSAIVGYLTFFVYYRLSSGKCTSKAKLNNKVVIVTGANTGIGFETAKDLALRGAKVILACRDQGRGRTARDKIISATGNNDVVYKQLDLASYKSVRAFAADIFQTETALHILINNAGAGRLDNSLTEDNLPVEMQINYFGPFLLTNLLLPLIKSSAPSRIINVSSLMHRYGTIDLKNIHKPATSWLNHYRVYSNSKLANVLFTQKLSRDLEGTGVTVNCVHPGLVSTDIFRRKSKLLQLLIRLFSKTPAEGAQTQIHLAVAPELQNVTGKYFVECVEQTPSSAARNKNLADELWKFSERICTN